MVSILLDRVSRLFSCRNRAFLFTFYQQSQPDSNINIHVVYGSEL
ncbi:hypothetical protein EC2867750_4100 [Escherichia coli 2867750]|nr:hypothetical protein EC2867750_4100 [Escherichia coli 2867750]EMV71605.1 hypothetical protein EC2866750_4055 [Escherichia coli 2866750]